MSTLDERLQTEADLCRNEGADDIAKLLDEAAAQLAQLRAARDEAKVIINLGVAIMTVEELSEWRGVRTWLEEYGETK